MGKQQHNNTTMPNGWKKNVRDIGRREGQGGAPFNYCKFINLCTEHSGRARRRRRGNCGKNKDRCRGPCGDMPGSKLRGLTARMYGGQDQVDLDSCWYDNAGLVAGMLAWGPKQVEEWMRALPGCRGGFRGQPGCKAHECMVSLATRELEELVEAGLASQVDPTVGLVEWMKAWQVYFEHLYGELKAWQVYFEHLYGEMKACQVDFEHLWWWMQPLRAARA